MKIEYSCEYTANSELFFVVFNAVVDGNTVVCHITAEALQDINPPCGSKSLSELYEENRWTIHEVASSLIEMGRVINGHLHISVNDFKNPL